MESVRTRAGEEISLTRTNAKVAGDRCDACTGRSLPPKETVLIIDMDSAEVHLCVKHEGYLLERLITNYVKRRTRDSKVGFIDDIEKPKEPKEEGIPGV